MTGKIKLVHSGGNSVSIAVPTSAPSASEVEFKLPQSDGSANQLLKTDGSGNLGFVTSAVGGKVLQVLHTQSTTYVATTASYTQLLTLAITPASSSNKVFVIGQVHCGANANNNAYTMASIFRGTTYSEDLGNTELDRGFSGYGGSGAYSYDGHTLLALDSPNTSSAQTYALTFGKGSTNTQSAETDARYSLTLVEIAA